MKMAEQGSKKGKRPERKMWDVAEDQTEKRETEK
jgi:hypothetical protein